MCFIQYFNGQRTKIVEFNLVKLLSDLVIFMQVFGKLCESLLIYTTYSTTCPAVK